MNTSFALFLTPEAQKYFQNKVKENQALKIELKPSGCSGYSYHFGIIEKTEKAFKNNGIFFEIEDKDKPHLNNTVIDFKKEGLNQKIIFDNPHAQNHCGCGESFSLKGV